MKPRFLNGNWRSNDQNKNLKKQTWKRPAEGERDTSRRCLGARITLHLMRWQCIANPWEGRVLDVFAHALV